jgi:hypothetical protein
VSVAAWYSNDGMILIDEEPDMESKIVELGNNGATHWHCGEQNAFYLYVCIGEICKPHNITKISASCQRITTALVGQSRHRANASKSSTGYDSSIYDYLCGAPPRL